VRRTGGVTRKEKDMEDVQLTMDQKNFYALAFRVIKNHTEQGAVFIDELDTFFIVREFLFSSKGEEISYYEEERVGWDSSSKQKAEEVFRHLKQSGYEIPDHDGAIEELALAQALQMLEALSLHAEEHVDYLWFREYYLNLIEILKQNSSFSFEDEK
jgi:hypothetical protein